MRLQNSLTGILVFLGFTTWLTAGLPELPVPPKIEGRWIRPAVFIIEKNGGNAAEAPRAIKAALVAFYGSLERNIASAGQGEPSAQRIAASQKVAQLSRDGVMPPWVENIVVGCEATDITIALYPRNAGWRVNPDGKLVHANVLAYVCVLEPKTLRLKDSTSLSAVSFRNLYQEMSREGLKTGSGEYTNMVDPLGSTESKENDTTD